MAAMSRNLSPAKSPISSKTTCPRSARSTATSWSVLPGDTLAAVQIINAVDEYQTQYLTLEKVVKILREKAATVSVQPVGVRLIVGGRNRKGVFTMTMMGSVDGYEPQTQTARKGAYLIEGACSHTDVAPWLEEEVKPQAANWHSLDDVAHTLDGCIAKMAKLDKSINTTYFRQLVM